MATRPAPSARELLPPKRTQRPATPEGQAARAWRRAVARQRRDDATAARQGVRRR